MLQKVMDCYRYMELSSRGRRYELEVTDRVWWDAVAEVFKLACTEGSAVTVEMFDEVFKSEDAFAFAQVQLSIRSGIMK